MLLDVAVSITVLASGSGGNCSVVSSSGTRLLIDAGLSCKGICKRLSVRDICPETLDAVLITHEHADHVTGLYVMAKKYALPIYMTEATHRAWTRQYKDSNGEPVRAEKVEHFHSGHRFQIGDIEIMPFTIPHDAADPVGFVFQAEGVRMAVATDLGYIPPNVKAQLKRVDLLLLESNHDLEMLRDGRYPWSVKQRVLSRVGHLSNEATATYLETEYDGQATYVILGHLSESNNMPELARITAERALNGRASLLANHLLLAAQHEPLMPISF